MEQPIAFKTEEEYDFQDCKGVNQNISDMHFNVKVEVEDYPEEQLDWCIENEIATFTERKSDYCKVINYEVLLQESEQKCDICKQTFNNRYELLKHNLTHLKVKFDTVLYKCDMCSIYCDNEDEIKRHIYSKHSEENSSIIGNYQNVFENNKAKNKCILLTKMLHQCNVCGKILSYRSWHSHMREVHAKGNIACPKCNLKFKCQRYLQKHILYKHSGIKCAWRSYKVKNADINCVQCNIVFNNKNSYKAHVRNCHSEEAQCDICKSKLKSKAYLLTHMGRVHYDDGKQHTCDICKKSYKSPRYLRVHKKNTHNKKKS